MREKISATLNSEFRFRIQNSEKFRIQNTAAVFRILNLKNLCNINNLGNGSERRT
jgi:hypothetical protein